MKPLTHHVLRGPLHPVRPGRAFVALALGSVLVTSACGQATPSPGAATPAGGDGPSATAGSTVDAGAGAETATSGGVRLEATMAPGGPEVGATGAGVAASPGLVVDYTLTNTGTKPVLAYDVVPADLGSATLPMDVDAKHAWVYEESGVLRLSKQGFAPGPNVRFAAAPVMGGHPIAPGARTPGRAYAGRPPPSDVPGAPFGARGPRS